MDRMEQDRIEKFLRLFRIDYLNRNKEEMVKMLGHSQLVQVLGKFVGDLATPARKK